MQISLELLEQLSNMKVGNAKTLDEKILLLIYSYEILLDKLKLNNN